MTEIATETSNLDKAIAGELLPGAGQPSHHLTQIGAAGALRDLGIQDEIIRDVLMDRHKVSKEEYARTQNWKADRMADQEFVAKYMAGDREAKRLMTLANVILSGGIREEKAA